ncbi:GTP cyclohydrolase II [Xylanimonas cellulosilytica DSM 15894]|uniref:GTP cyclohydrolase-2 n=1 Tax=Xylanimonas cellulosilytica (strain DSM 15894 / JCM 12276 / CECT 5975 / KCTC 9989 / LMG 20990 / NBRC 107835 / XIL07) TaxID=446471 RepID=D1BSQ9_XYLCX|nr:bifunctional 3,4-dihydroxy-2-butanone-4-phosphate synthase/GTP cyclohydrolase II [Xylanimonas cellulosilytica]ACZ30751.1 GTP cyclohydrolase II [Xylanimonas cellulosilytica DSM 15894]
MTSAARRSPAPPAIARALAALADGRPVLVADDLDRESEVDVVLAATHATAAWVAWTVRHSSGYLCAPMPAERADVLDLPLMVADNRDPRRTAYCVSVDAAAGVTTGISAADRARTLRVLADPAATPADLIRPGHVLPLRAVPGGVLERPGHTEAAVDLVRLAGAGEVGVIAELVHDDGTMVRLHQARALAAQHGLELLTIADLARWLRDAGPVVPTRPTTGGGEVPRVVHVAASRLPTEHGEFRLHAFHDLLTGAEHVALVADGAGTAGEHTPWVRVHSECLTGDSFGSLRCDCGPQLRASLRAVAEHGGAVVHLHGHEGRGIGLSAKVAAYALQDQGRDTVEANVDLGLPVDAREYGAAAAILRELGLDRIRLLTNNPLKADGLRAAGIDVVGREPLEVGLGPENEHYLTTKKRSMGHLLRLSSIEPVEILKENA